MNICTVLKRRRYTSHSHQISMMTSYYVLRDFQFRRQYEDFYFKFQKNIDMKFNFHSSFTT